MSTNGEKVRVVLRYDDSSARSSMVLECNLIEALADLGMQCSLGVTPFICEGDFHDPSPQKKLPLSGEKATLLKEAARDGHIEVALHGCHHQLWKAASNGEFGGLAPEEQERRIIAGRKELEDRLEVSITSFIPPWNGYDENTMRILRDQEFRCLSASLRGPFLGTSERWFLPFSFWFRGLREVVATALKLSRFQPVLVLMLHDFDFFESGHPDAYMTVDDCKKELAWLNEIPDVVTVSIGQATDQGVALSGAQLSFQKAWRAACQRVPYRYRVLLEDQVLFAGLSRAIGLQNFMYQTYVSLRRMRRDLTSAVARRAAKRSVPSK